MTSRARPQQRLYLDTPVAYLKGVGPVRAAALRRLGVVTAGDLLFHVPHRYEDASTVSPINSLLLQGQTAFPGTAQFGIRNLSTGQVIAGSNTAALNALNGNGLLEQT